MMTSLHVMGQIPPFTYYQPVTPRRSQSTLPLRDPIAENMAWIESNAAIARQQQYMNETVHSETVTGLAYHVSKNAIEAVQISVAEKRNGSVELTCIGIKRNDKWTSIKSPVYDLQQIYNNCKENESEAKSNILSMMEVANFCFFLDNDLYLTGLKDN